MGMAVTWGWPTQEEPGKGRGKTVHVVLILRGKGGDGNVVTHSSLGLPGSPHFCSGHQRG